MNPKHIENSKAELDFKLQFFREEFEKHFEEKHKNYPSKKECIVCKTPLVSKQEIDDWMCGICEDKTNEVAKIINPNYKKIMTKNEEQNLEALKIGFENTEWDDFLLVLNEIRDRDKEIIAMYRKSHIELKELKKALAKEEKANTPETLDKQQPKALIIDGVSQQSELLAFEGWVNKNTTTALKDGIKLALENYKKANCG